MYCALESTHHTSACMCLPLESLIEAPHRIEGVGYSTVPPAPRIPPGKRHFPAPPLFRTQHVGFGLCKPASSLWPSPLWSLEPLLYSLLLPQHPPLRWGELVSAFSLLPVVVIWLEGTYRYVSPRYRSQHVSFFRVGSIIA